MKEQCEIVPGGGCWLWKGFVHKNGYGEMSYHGDGKRVHRLSYFLFKGPIPEGMDVCHACDVRHCVNPDHLWIGTRKQNMEDCSSKRRHGNMLKTHCVNGHEFTPDNIIWRMKPSGRKARDCKTCQSYAYRAWRKKQRAQVEVDASHGR